MDQNTQSPKPPANNHSQSQSNGQTSANGLHDHGHSQQETDMLYRLKGAIDQNGRYSYRLNDMASGLSAGAGISTTEARYEIEEKFSNQFGVSPHEYLERQFSQRDELKREHGRSKGRGR